MAQLNTFIDKVLSPDGHLYFYSEATTMQGAPSKVLDLNNSPSIGIRSLTTGTVTTVITSTDVIEDNDVRFVELDGSATFWGRFSCRTSKVLETMDTIHAYYHTWAALDDLKVRLVFLGSDMSRFNGWTIQKFKIVVYKCDKETFERLSRLTNPRTLPDFCKHNVQNQLDPCSILKVD